MQSKRASFALILLLAACGNPSTPAPNPKRVDPAARAADFRQRAESAAAVLGSDAPRAKQILFGDLHVHTTISADAFLMALPFLQGEGVHPPADACDYARFCSGLDFWSINDHAESISPRNWQQTKEAVRRCNAVAGEPSNPDLVTFLGWEWTQVGTTAAEHYGHKNVIFKDTEDARVPVRPISALTPQVRETMRSGVPLSLQIRTVLADWSHRSVYFNLAAAVRELQATPLCADGIDVHDLPVDCIESADTPEVLFEKLAQWGYDTLVIPHGTTWGLYTPPDSSWDKQLSGGMHDPDRQTLIELYSGHGNAEEFRSWRAVESDGEGGLRCPQPTSDYEPCCWRAGEIIRSRCGDVAEEECDARVAAARQNYVDAGVLGHNTVPGARVEDWLDCGQCRDCYNPAFQYRPGGSAQYALAVSNFDEASEKRRFRFGFIASSDNHTARPGTGYKEFARQELTEASGPCSEEWRNRVLPPDRAPEPESLRFRQESAQFIDDDGRIGNQIWETERSNSFFLTGGLVAVHAAGRDRESIWKSLKQREVYGTSGDRILLWFDLLNSGDGIAPMGSEVAIAEVPRFRVRAVGAQKQLPGCPAWSEEALSPNRLEKICRGECYHPSDERRRIERIEIVRVRPQQRPGQPIGERIEDPWKVFECAPDVAGCAVEFDDPELFLVGDESIYYARALQEPTDAVNAANLRCEYDADGNCVKVNPCSGDYRTSRDDDCLAPNRERAWSSPIYIHPEPAG